MSKKVYVDLSQQDVQDIINAYEKDIEKFNKQKEVLDKIKKYINKHCVNQDVSKEVGFKCFTMADTQELEHIWNLLEEIE